MRNQVCQTGETNRAVQTQVVREMPFSGHGRFSVEKYRRPTILQLNVEGLTRSKIHVIEQLAHRNRAFVILLQETHCTSAEKLVIPRYTLAGSTSSMQHGLATFVHESLKWSYVEKSPADSGSEWLCINVDGY